MSLLDAPAAAPGLQILGWTLLHALWQGALVALVLAALLRATRRASSALRYALACTGLAVTVGLALTTALSVRADWAEHQACWRAADAAAPLAPECLDHGILPPEDREHYEELAGAVRLDPLYAGSLGLTPVLAWGAALWLGAGALLLLRTGMAWRRVARLRSRGARPLGGGLDDAVRPLRESLGIERRVDLLRSTRVDVPMVVGWRRPAVLFPAAVLDRLSAAELEAVLAHELAHVRRHDFAVNLLQAAADAFLFFHPGARWISRRIRAEREFCCDELALRAVPGRLPTYLRALLAIESLRLPPQRHALAVTGGALLPRARRLAEGTPASWGARSAIALLLGGALFWAPALALEEAVDLSSWAVMTLDLEARRAPPAERGPSTGAPDPGHAGH